MLSELFIDEYERLLRHGSLQIEDTPEHSYIPYSDTACVQITPPETRQERATTHPNSVLFWAHTVQYDYSTVLYYTFSNCDALMLLT